LLIRQPFAQTPQQKIRCSTVGGSTASFFVRVYTQPTVTPNASRSSRAVRSFRGFKGRSSSIRSAMKDGVALTRSRSRWNFLPERGHDRFLLKFGQIYRKPGIFLEL